MNSPGVSHLRFKSWTLLVVLNRCLAALSLSSLDKIEVRRGQVVDSGSLTRAGRSRSSRETEETVSALHDAIPAAGIGQVLDGNVVATTVVEDAGAIEFYVVRKDHLPQVLGHGNFGRCCRKYALHTSRR